MDIQTILLGFLMKKSMTGYELKNAFSISFSFFSGISYGSIYPALKKMEQLGDISVKIKVQEKAPNRKICTITEKGKKRFQEALTAPLPLERLKNPFLSRLFFSSRLSTMERMDLATRYLQDISDKQEQLEAFQQQIEKTADPFQLLCFKHGLEMVRDKKKTIKKIITALEGMQAVPCNDPDRSAS